MTPAADPRRARDPVGVLQRWEQFGGTWRVVSAPGAPIVVSMARCDGGEEVDRLTSDDPALVAWLAGRTSSD